MPPTSSSFGSPALALVHKGWDELKHQRPLAARGFWQQALRTEPDLKQAKQAIAALEKANDLPVAARVAYRFRHPENSDQRARWQEVLGDADVTDLNTASTLFADLAQADPTDAVARYNEALCLAWSGQNLPAVAALDRSLRLDAHAHPELAAEAWTIAEILRQGAGAETLADDLRYSLTIPWNAQQTPDLLDLFPEIRRVPTPKTPGEDAFVEPEIELYEWLDGPSVTAAADLINTARNVLATLTVGRRVLRLSSPILTALEQVEERLLAKLDNTVQGSIRREVTPLPIPFMDADVWAVRLAPDTDPDLGLELVRDAVERYYENEWIHRPRQSLDGRSPLAAAALARQGNPIARAQLSAVIRVRQQLGERPTAIRLYQGYPFDRLRRRLGIDLLDPDSVDPDDLSCAPPDHLDQLDVATLDVHRAADAASSAAGLRQDDRTARFVTHLLNSPETPFPIPRFSTLVAACVRLAMSRQDIRTAIDWIERSIPWTAQSDVNTLRIWQAEILARSAQPATAFEIYSDLIKQDTSSPLLALDAAETMIDNNHLPHAESLLETTLELAKSQNRPGIKHQATRLLESVND